MCVCVCVCACACACVCVCMHIKPFFNRPLETVPDPTRKLLKKDFSHILLNPTSLSVMQCCYTELAQSVNVWQQEMCCFLTIWCLFQGWDVGTLANTLSGCVTQDPRVGPSEACAIHPTRPVCLVVCMSEAYSYWCM